MSKYCPYIDKNVVYLQCQDCTKKICSPDTFFCLVVGSRSFSDYGKLQSTLDYLLTNQSSVVIVSGGAAGADAMAGRYAEERGYPLLVYPADWKKHGNSAGYIRNEQMHAFLSRQKKRGCVAFWDGASKGTQHSFALAERFGNPLRIIRT